MTLSTCSTVKSKFLEYDDVKKSNFADRRISSERSAHCEENAFDCDAEGIYRDALLANDMPPERISRMKAIELP